jgi:hypothetical protein
VIQHRNNSFFKKNLAGLFVWFIATTGVLAQNTTFEFWPEAEIWYKATPGLRVASYSAITRYFESESRDYNLTLLADHSFGNSKKYLFTRLQDQNRAETLKVWLLRGGYMGGWSLGDPANKYSEDMLFAEIHKRFLLKRLVLFSQRLRFDNRWLGQDPEYSYRIRYRVSFEREFLKGKTSVVPFISVEPYWDSRFDMVNRVRAVGGATVSWRHRFALEGNLTYQHDSKSSTSNMLAFNAILHLHFESAKVRANAGKK